MITPPRVFLGLKFYLIFLSVGEKREEHACNPLEAKDLHHSDRPRTRLSFFSQIALMRRSQELSHLNRGKRGTKNMELMAF